MELLENLELARRHLLGWKPTWLGFGVFNWQRQVEASLYRDPNQPPPEPRAGENGHDPGPECNAYRELYFMPGICWCLRPAREHSSHLPELALEFLQWHNEIQRSQKLLLEGTGRDLTEMLVQLTTLERSLIRHLWSRERNSIRLGELASRFVCLVDFFTLKMALDHLQELDLVVVQPEIALTWDGRGLARWISEVELGRAGSGYPTVPNPGENGVDLLASPCDHYRELLGEPKRCWCGWGKLEH